MGIAIKLPNKDYSTENLGQVTFKISNEAQADIIATAYCTALNDFTFKRNIYNMVLDLLYEGLWDKISVLYPILGNSVSTLSINLKDIEYNSLLTYANASAGSKKLVFSNTIGVGETSDSPMDGFNGELSYYAVFAHIAESNYGWNMMNFKGNGVGVSKIYKSGGVYYVQWGGVNTDINGEDNTIMQIGVSNVGTGNTCNIIKNGLHYDSATSALGVNILPNLSIGVNAGETIGTSGEIIEQTTNLFKGDLYFYSIGKLTEAENIKLDGIVKTFLDDVKYEND